MDYFKIDPKLSMVIDKITKELDYFTFLENTTRDASIPKRQRTRNLLQLTCLRLIEKKNIEDVRIEHIVVQANLSRGTFYQYYQKSTDAIVDSLESFYSEVWKNRPLDNLFEDALSYIFVTRLYYSNTFASSSILFYWYWHLSKRYPEMNKTRAEQAIDSINLQVSLLPEMADTHQSNVDLRIMLRSAALMWNEMLIAFYLEDDKTLIAGISNSLELTNHSVRAWFRTVYGRDPVQAEAIIRISDN